MNKGITYDGNDLKIVDYEKSYDFISGVVGGLIERVPITAFDEKNIDLWCNEEGKLNTDLPINAYLMYNGSPRDYLVGNLAFTKTDGKGNTITLNDDDIKFIKDYFDSADYCIGFENNGMIVCFNY